MDTLWRNVTGYMGILLDSEKAREAKVEALTLLSLTNYPLKFHLKTTLTRAMLTLAISSNKCHQLMALLFNIRPNDQANCTSASYTTGTCFSVSGDPIFSTPTTWIIGSGAISHICANASVFIAVPPLHGSTVLFPNEHLFLSFSLGISGLVLSYF